jgi:hypothetical protein
VARQYRAAVVHVAETAGKNVGMVTVEETDVRRIERAAADIQAAYELFAEIRDLIEVHGTDDYDDRAC